MSFELKRIMIIGASGSGKSTLARALGEKLDLPVVHGDHFYFDPNWVQKPKAETVGLFMAAASQDAWIMDGNNGSSMEFRAERSDVIIYMELGKWPRLSRTLWRSMKYFGRTRPDIPEGCREQFDPKFHFDWVLGFDKRQKPKMEWFIAEWQYKKPVIRLNGPKAVTRFLDDPALAMLEADPF